VTIVLTMMIAHFHLVSFGRFLDMLLHKAIGGGPSEPKYFWNIFEVHFRWSNTFLGLMHSYVSVARY
jgi:hypothetical protein